MPCLPKNQNRKEEERLPFRSKLQVLYSGIWWKGYLSRSHHYIAIVFCLVRLAEKSSTVRIASTLHPTNDPSLKPVLIDWLSFYWVLCTAWILVAVLDTVVKGIVGAGVLSLPAGIAAFGNAPSAALPAVMLIAFIGGLSAYGFGLTGRVCAITKTTTYRDAWSKAISAKSSWIPAWTVTFKTFCAILAYSMILGETFKSLLAAFTGHNLSTWVVLPSITTGVLLPLCLLKNLSSLAPFSLLGSMGMVYTALAMFWRYVTKAYTTTGKFGADLAPNLRPAFGSVGASGIFDPKAAILLGMLSTAYMARK